MGTELLQLPPLISLLIWKVITLFGDPGAGLLYGPIVFKGVWDRVGSNAKRKNIEYAEEFDRADPLINLAIHIFSFISAWIYFVFLNIPRAISASRLSSDFAHLCILFYFVVAAFGLYVILGKITFKTKHIEAYYKIDSEQTLPPNIPLTYLRFGFGTLYIATTFGFSLVVAI